MLTFLGRTNMWIKPGCDTTRDEEIEDYCAGDFIRYFKFHLLVQKEQES